MSVPAQEMSKYKVEFWKFRHSEWPIHTTTVLAKNQIEAIQKARDELRFYRRSPKQVVEVAHIG